MRTLIQISTAVGAAATAAVLLAACGGGSGTATTANAAQASSTGGSASAYRDCLSQHGVTLPSRGTNTARPTDRPSGQPTARRSGGGGGFGGLGAATANPSFSAAAQACASLRPTGGFGNGGRGGTQLVAFRNCMTQQGEPVPTTRPTATASPTASSTDKAARYLNGLNAADPKVAAALKVCDALLPTKSASAQPSGSSTG